MALTNGISGLVGKLVVESEVNCNADKYYQIYKNHENIPRAIPHIVTSAKAVEGYGTTSGCVKEWGYVHEGKTLACKEKTTYNDETRTICHSVFEGDVMNDYKKLDLTLVIDQKANGHGSIVKYILEYEKINQDSPVPISYLFFCQQITEDLNTHLCASD